MVYWARPKQTMNNQSALSQSSTARIGIIVVLLLALLGVSGCAGLGAPVSLATVSRMSPPPEDAGPVSASARAAQYVASHPGTQIALGSGDSMMPLYRDNTMIVIRKVPMAQLKRGMTVVYISREGWPIAHALVERNDDGWVAMGLHNPDCHPETVRGANYVGVVVKAFQSQVNPMLAISRALSTETGQIASARPAMSGLVARLP